MNFVFEALSCISRNLLWNTSEYAPYIVLWLVVLKVFSTV